MRNVFLLFISVILIGCSYRKSTKIDCESTFSHADCEWMKNFSKIDSSCHFSKQLQFARPEKDSNLTYHFRPDVVDSVSNCVGLYCYEKSIKKFPPPSHNTKYFFLKYEDKIILSTEVENAAEVVDNFLSTYSDKFTQEQKERIRSTFISRERGSWGF